MPCHLPDLSIVSKDIVPSNLHPAIGEVINISAPDSSGIVHLQATAHNIGTPTSSPFYVQWYDGEPSAGGTPIGSPIEVVNLLASGETITVDTTLPIGVMPAGEYEISASAVENGVFVGGDSVTFNVLPDRHIEAIITADKISYNANETVTLNSTQTNTGTNSSYGNLSAEVSISGPAGGVFAETRTFGSLLPCASTSFNTFWNTGVYNPGSYTATLMIKNESGIIEAAVTTSFNIISTAESLAGLIGNISVAPSTLESGGALNIQYTLTNNGNADITGKNARIIIALPSPAQATVQQEIINPVNIPKGQAVSFENTANIDCSYYGTYLVMLRVEEKPLDSTTFTVIDTKPPIITVSGVNDGAYYNTDIPPEISIDECHPKISSVTLNWQAFQSGTIITQEGTYTLAVTTEDIAGNSASKSVSFTIDKTPPQIVVTGVEDGVEYDDYVTPVINIIEPNLMTSTITLNGEPFVLGTTVTEEGDYVLYVRADDLAGNVSEKTIRFSIVLVRLEVTKELLTNYSNILVWLTDDLCPNSMDSTMRIKNFLSDTLSSTATYINFAYTNKEFLEGLRSGLYNTYIVVDIEDGHAQGIICGCDDENETCCKDECEEGHNAEDREQKTDDRSQNTDEKMSFPHVVSGNPKNSSTSALWHYSTIQCCDDGGMCNEDDDEDDDENCPNLNKIAFEITEAVNHGAGLLVIKDTPAEWSKFREVLGVHFEGQEKSKEITVNSSAISEPWKLTLSGDKVSAEVELSRAKAVAYYEDDKGCEKDESPLQIWDLRLQGEKDKSKEKVKDKKEDEEEEDDDDKCEHDGDDEEEDNESAIAINNHGMGSAITFAFDVTAVNEEDRIKEILRKSVEYVRPAQI